MLLIDLDPIIYACGFASQSNHHELVVEDRTGNKSVAHTTELAAWKKQHPELEILAKETRVEPAPESHALMIFDKTLRELTDGNPWRGYVTSGVGNFRDDIATIRPYKGNRDKSARPYHYKMLKEHAISRPGVEYVVGMEADDAISIAAHLRAWGDKTVVVSVDKDLDQIQGQHWNYTKEKGYYEVDEQRAQDTLVRQWIMGDSTDNIQGVPGIGPKKADSILERWRGADREGIYGLVLDLYGGAEGACNETARLVYLLRKPTEIWEAEKWIAGTQ